MRFTPTDDERHAREALRGFLGDTIGEQRYEQICAHSSGTDAALWKSLASSGWLDLVSMADDEGSEISSWPIGGTVLAEEFGRTLVPLPVELVAGWLLPVLRSCEAAWASDAAELADGLPAVSLSLLSGPPAVTLRVHAASDGIVLDGELRGVQFGAAADVLYLPLALPDGDWVLARVPLDQAGISTVATITVDPGRRCATVVFADVPVPAVDLVRTSRDGAPLETTLRRALLSYYLVLDGKAIGAAQAMLERTVRYVEQRTQFGVPIGSFQAIKHRVADMATAIETARALAGYTAWQVARGSADCDRHVLASRLYCADMFRAVCESAIQCHGGMGFTWEQGLHYWYKSSLFDAAADGVETKTLARLLEADV
jgi:alkylation response protein AidB-like acyl-CoA dehydrogenase